MMASGGSKMERTHEMLWMKVKLEESGKILGKDLWVRAHSKETPLELMLEREIAPVDLNGLNEVTTTK
jgi:hypothetical protein